MATASVRCIDLTVDAKAFKEEHDLDPSDNLQQAAEVRQMDVRRLKSSDAWGGKYGAWFADCSWVVPDPTGLLPAVLPALKAFDLPNMEPIIDCHTPTDALSMFHTCSTRNA